MRPTAGTLMKLDARSSRILDSLPESEARLIRDAAIATDVDAETLELACLRLRNIASRYDEWHKRARLTRARTGDSDSAEAIAERLELVRDALVACRERLRRIQCGD
jgi:hypothetical protein